ncbi:MAG: hypothetical protein CR982_06315 [Candidatus Cloacimonadota bacterium]|nr:MAG: hypothetical protein CR982_06315 [Candidatus Cloacimonadota bacterium]PIE78469.1 MAG: hypothetical protein CSA15_07685 [Candidatus Delongbacteria bacterium]
MKNLILVLVIFIASLRGDQLFSGYSFFNTYSAQNLNIGEAQISTQLRGYRKAKAYGDIALSNFTGVVGGNFGFNNNIEFGANLVFYQDIHYDANQDLEGADLSDYNSPDAIYLRLKFGNYKFNFYNEMIGVFALATSYRFTSKKAGLMLEPYSNRSLELNATGIFSLYLDPVYYEDGQQLHFNLGIMNHNDSDNNESVTAFVESTIEMTYGLTYVYPHEDIDYFIELYGNSFLHWYEDQKIIPYSSEPYVYLTPGLKWSPFSFLELSLGLDILLYTKYDDQNSSPKYEFVEYNNNIPYYAPWRGVSRLSYYPTTMISESENLINEELHDPDKVRNRKELFEWLIDEPERVESVELKLEKMKENRKKIERKVDKLKKKVEKNDE